MKHSCSEGRLFFKISGESDFFIFRCSLHINTMPGGRAIQDC